MTREQKIAKAARLKALDIRLAVIAKSIGEPLWRVVEWTRDVSWPERECFVCGSAFTPAHGNQKSCCGENARKRWHDENKRASCTDCGVECCAGSAWREISRCAECNFKALERERAGRDDLLISLWNQGLPMREIAARLDTTVNALNPRINRLRREGRPVPYRNRGFTRFPDQVAA